MATYRIAVSQPGHEIMETSRHTSPTILAVAILAAGAFLLQQNGFFNGAFRTEILARVDAADVVSGVDMAVTARNVDSAQTASVR